MFNSPSVFSALLKIVSPLLGIAGSLLQMIHERNRPLFIMKHPSLGINYAWDMYRIFLTHPCSNSSLLLSNMSMMDETPSAEGEGVLRAAHIDILFSPNKLARWGSYLLSYVISPGGQDFRVSL